MIYIEEVFGRRCTESIDPVSPVDILILAKIVKQSGRQK